MAVRRTALLGFSLFHKFERQDIFDKIPEKSQTDQEVLEDGWYRLKKMYSFDKYGNLSPQFAMVTDGAMFGLIAGFIIGGVNDSKEAYIKFIQEHKATIFNNHIEAKRALQDTITKNLMKGGWRMGWRLSILTTTALITLTSLNTYRGKSSIIEFTSAGATACGIYKFKQGFKPMISGTVFGGFLGTLVGLIMLALMKTTNLSMGDIYSLDANRIEKYTEKKLKKIDNLRTEMLEKSNIKYERDPVNTSSLQNVPESTSEDH